MQHPFWMQHLLSELSMIDYYEILQVSPHAEPEIIEAAYKRLALKYHPDTNPSPVASAQMKWINQAYDVLRDPERRVQYDDERRAYQSSLRPAAQPAPTPPQPVPHQSEEAPTPQPAPPNPPYRRRRPKRHRLRACLTFILLLALAALGIYGLQYFGLFPVFDYMPTVPYEFPRIPDNFFVPPTSTPVPPTVVPLAVKVASPR
jgi:curved DNA-binding protein CbpA